ncbi:hypothetical protein ATKI12_0252 [Kitasatospora sp. Ki12]
MSVPASYLVHPRVTRVGAAFGTSLHQLAGGSGPDRARTAYAHNAWRTIA